MSFNTAITGLKSASTMLDVTGNNIANVATTGFKSSRTEFADIYATSVVGAGASNTPGSGVTISRISQDFSAGTIEFTNNNLDLAINGSGFFQLSDGQGGITYTRSGAFELNKDGEIVSKSGKFLQGEIVTKDGDILPVNNLKVSQKESLPQATQNISLSVNIDARADATKLLPVYNKDEPGSFTYSTTVRNFDSIGFEQSIKFNFAEQRPVKEQYQFNLSSNGTDTTFVLSGVALNWNDPAQFTTDGTSFILDVNSTVAQQLRTADPRIDANSVKISFIGTPATTPVLGYEVKSQYSSLGDYAIRDSSAAIVQPSLVTERPANEVRTYSLNFSENVGPPQEYTAAGNITIGGVQIPIKAGQSPTLIAQAIRSSEASILDRNPLIESVQIDTSGANPEIKIVFKASEGLIQTNNLRPIISAEAGTITFGDTTADATLGTVDTRIVLQPNDRAIGDNSFLAQYRLYAYLKSDDTDELLDLGKPGTPGLGSLTEPGPILISFDSTSGLLNGVNVFGDDDIFNTGAQVPAIKILGADPSDPDNDDGIRLDLTNTTQFASASIVKNQQQDGYTKGDLIGVTFNPTGEMVASFSNGQNQTLGIVAFATFENQDGLRPAGDTEWIATLASGDAILNPPGTGLNGTLRSAALEQSNVDLSTELVALIQAQRNFQASSKTLETANNITQTILNI